MKLNCQQLKSCIVQYLQYCSVIMLLLNAVHLQDSATPLYLACQEGHLPVVQHLIGAKADVNTPKKVGCIPAT